MAILNNEEREFLRVIFGSQYTGRTLRRSVSRWAEENQIDQNNYENEMRNPFNNKSDDLCYMFAEWEINGTIESKLMNSAALDFDKFERWYLATLRAHDKNEQNLDNKEQLKYNISSVRKLLAIGILESVFQD